MSNQNVFYVYTYTNPITNNIFYIGKGKNNRYLDHLNENKENTENYYKWCAIESLRKKNLLPIIEKIKENLSEEEAYSLETKLIQKYGRKGIDKNGILTNRCLNNKPPRWETYPMEEQILIRQKCGDATRNKPKPKEQKEKMSKSRIDYLEKNPQARILMSVNSKRIMNLPENLEKGRQKLLQNPMNDGIPEHNGNAYLWKFTDPNGIETIVKGRYKHFSKENNLSTGTFTKSLKTGIWPKAGKNVGWRVEKIMVS